MKLSLWWSRFSAWPKIQVRNLNILRTRRAFKAKQKAFFTIFKRLSVVKNFLRLDWKCTFKVNHANWKRALINDCLRISKVPRKFYIPTTCNVAIIYPCVKFAIFLKPSLLFNSFYCWGLFSCHIRVLEWIYTLQLSEYQGDLCSKQARYLKFEWLQRDYMTSLSKWFSVHQRTKWFWVSVPLQSFMFLLPLSVKNKTLRLNKLKSRTAMNAKTSIFVACVDVVIYFLLCNLHDCIFNCSI